MQEVLYSQIKEIVNCELCGNERAYKDFLERVEQGSLTRDENPASHFCAYFLPFNPKLQKVFIVHHKKSGLWLSPGGHIDKGETLLETLNREIEEELGVQKFFKTYEKPFLLSVTQIKNDIRPCKTHYDIWHLVITDGKNFNVTPEEFYDTKWMTFEETKNFVTEQNNIMALEIFKNII